jgi:hypothetical protein
MRHQQFYAYSLPGQRVLPSQNRFIEGAAMVKTSLNESNPEVASEWHSAKNGELTPNDVSPASGKKVWWQRSVDPSHEWQAVVRSRAQGSGCPYCCGRLASPATSIAALYPHIAAEWHPERNGDVKPEQIRPGAGRKVWWRCSVNPSHEWQAKVQHRVNGSGCWRFVGGVSLRREIGYRDQKFSEHHDLR